MVLLPLNHCEDNRHFLVDNWRLLLALLRYVISVTVTVTFKAV